MALARDIIDAAQTPEMTGLCALVGRADIPQGLLRYHQAILDGLTTEIAVVGRPSDKQTGVEAVQFRIPDGQGKTTLVLAFQAQSRGWVVLFADFVPG